MLRFDVSLHEGVALDLLIVLVLLLPPVLIETLPKEYDEGQHLVFPILLVYSIAESKQVQGEYFVDLHLLPVLLCQIVVVAQPEVSAGLPENLVVVLL